MTDTKTNPATGDGGARQQEFQIQEPASNSQTTSEKQALVIGAEIDSSTNCRVGNHDTTGRTPIFGMCRELLAQGVSPDAAVEIYRAGILALTIRSLREGAGLTVDEHNGTRFAKWKPFCHSAGSPRIAPVQRAAAKVLP